MIKGLEEIKRLKWGLDITHEERINLCEYIEKELKQAEKDKEMLDIFESALTIEHDLSTPSFTPLEKDKPFNVSAIITETIKIKQNELDEKLRKSLREWVLKNAFPKELKRLKELEKAFDTLSKDHEKAMKELSLEIEKNRALEILRECNLTIEELNKKFYFISGKVPKDKTDLLKEVLL